MSAGLAIVLFLLAVVLIVGGAELLLDGLLRAAARLRVTPYAVAVIISGLEVENLAAGIAANAKGLPGAAAGTFLGGTTFLALGVAGLGALIAPIPAELPRPALALTAAAALPLLALSLDSELTRPDGVLLVLWSAFALALLVKVGTVRTNPEDAERERAAARAGRGRFWTLAPLAGGLALLTAGGEALAEGVRGLVERFDISPTLFGNTAIAAAVEAEEVVRIAVPARRGRGDIALGNIVGSIVHFVTLNAGVIAIVRPLELDSESLHLHLPVAVGATAVLCAVLGLRPTLGRVEGVVLLALYGLYLGAAVTVGV